MQSELAQNADAWREERSTAEGCTRCHLFRFATQTVFGEGPTGAPIMLVGEQPGDREDLSGRPFVGPAGQLLDRALEEAGLDRGRLYITNAVKHFKFVQRGKRRLHSKPDAGEIDACRWWLDRERALVRPDLVVAMGATAIRSLFGKILTIGRMRGEMQILAGGERALVTVHPSYLLRIRESDRAKDEYRRFVADLVQARQLAGLS